ncbi:Putative Mitochondrial phosphate carrier protein [Penicillium digitatum]|nr:Putative Mitochondrial phosphate carrier protein [Penicillium digitatum]
MGRCFLPSLNNTLFPQFTSVFSAMWITRGISLVNFGVASSALAFQVFVLYPWHNQLDDEFKSLKKEHQRVLKQLDLRKITA